MHNSRLPNQQHSRRANHGASLVGFVLALCNTSIKAWLDVLENSLHTLLREAAALYQRSLNGASAWVIGVFHRGYKAQLKNRWSQLSEQYGVWAGPAPSSTLNAVLARDCGSSAGGGTPPAAAGTPPADQPAPASPQQGLRQRRPAADAAGPAGQQPAAAAHKARPPEIQPAGEQESSSNLPVQDGSAASDEQWFAPSTWLSGIADEASEAAAAAQEAASAAVQQAATSVSHVVEEAAATAAAWARSMRAVFVEPPAGWGVHEAIHRTGLLEDVSLQGQLLISRCFDALRWLLAKLTFTAAPAGTPTAAAAAAAASGQRPGYSSTSGTSSSAGAGVFSRMHRLLSPSDAAAVGGAVHAGPPGSGHAHIRGRLKLRSVTSMDLPRTRMMHLEVGEEQTSSCSDSDSCSADESCSPDAYAEAHQELRASHASASTSQHAAAAAKAAGLPGLTVRVPSSGSRIKPSGRVSFAAGEGPAAADASPAAAADGPSPFGMAAVQTRHQADIDAASASTPPGRRASPAPSAGRSSTGSTPGGGAVMHGRGARALQRSHSGPPMSELRDVTSAGQVIRMAGYPLEVHEVVTADGYLLRLERIPLPASRDVVFMMHGVLDTSLTWVAGGITGSQAFAAFDRGFDVWLGTSRSNPPHEAVDPARRGSAYWLYTNNEVGVYDMGAQLDHIHAIKMRELAGHSRSKSSGSSRRGSRAAGAAASGSGGRRSSSSSAQPMMQQQQAGGGSSGHRDILAELLGGDDDGSGIAAGGVPSVVFEVSEGGLEGAGGPDGSSTPAAGGSIQQLQLQRATSSGGDSSGSRDDVYQPAMSRTPSAAEIDEAAAAEAAEALSRHRAAMAAAGVAAPAAAQQQDGAASHQEPATPRQQGVLLTPTAAAAAAAAARAANALGSAVAAAAAAASGVVGAAASGVAAAAGGTPRADADAGGGSDGSADGCHVHVTAHGVSLGSCDAADAADDLARSSGHAATTVLTGASGLFERLLGGTTPLSSSNGALDGSGDAQQQQQQQRQLEAYQAQRGMRHSSSAPDVSAAADALGRAGSLAAGVSPAVEHRQQQHASAVAAAGRGSGSGRGRIRRGSWPWSPAVAAGAADKLGAQQQDTQVEPPAAAAAGESPTAATMASPFGQEPQQGAQEEQQLQQQANEEPQQQPCASSSDAAGMADAAASCSSRLASTASTASSARWDRAAAARPYNLRVVAHSLGGFLALIYATQRARAGRPHHISRLILLSPAGYHPVIPTLFKPLVYVWRPFMAAMYYVWRQQAFPVHLPTFVVRMLAFKLSMDTTRLPAVGDLLRGFAKLVLGGDRSAWDRALLMPHYAAAGMPLLSSRQVLHFIQLYLTRRCQLFDYGSIAANVAAYQQPTPPCVSDAFHTLRDVPVHLVAGRHDGVIPPGNVQQHYRAMRAAGVDVSYRQFDYGHMDMTFSAKEELGWYVMSLLMRK